MGAGSQPPEKSFVVRLTSTVVCVEKAHIV